MLYNHNIGDSFSRADSYPYPSLIFYRRELRWIHFCYNHIPFRQRDFLHIHGRLGLNISICANSTDIF